MNRTYQSETSDPLAEALEADLFREYGVMLTGKNLIKILGYPSKDAFRQACRRGTVPVPLFEIENRRGKYALVKDVARWLAHRRATASVPKDHNYKGGE